MPVKPFNEPPEQQVAREVEEFVPPEVGEIAQPFVSYVNHLHVYPKYLKYDNQKSFAKVQITFNILHIIFMACILSLTM